MSEASPPCVDFQTRIPPENVAPISVIIPAHNEERFIGDSIRSVFAQTLPVSEVIAIIDDCTDGTKQIASELGVTVVEQKRRNMAAALNLGISVSSQPWIAFLDADDLWHEEKIARQWKAIETFSDAGLIACDSFTLMENEVLPFERILKKRWRNVSRRVSLLDLQYISRVDGSFFKHFYLKTPCVVLRREAILKVGLLNEELRFWQTMEFFARVLRHYPLTFVEQPLVYQRIHDANHSRDTRGYWTAHIAMTELMLKHPDLYPPGTGEAHRELLKRDFHLVERELARAAV